MVTSSATSSFSSAVGHWELATDGSRLSISHISSARYGATRESAWAVKVTASRTAGSAGPQPASMALRVALTSSMMRATTTLYRPPSSSSVMSAMLR